MKYHILSIIASGFFILSFWSSQLYMWHGLSYLTVISVSLSRLLPKICDISKFREMWKYCCVAEYTTCSSVVLGFMWDTYNVFSFNNVTRQYPKDYTIPSNHNLCTICTYGSYPKDCQVVNCWENADSGFRVPRGSLINSGLVAPYDARHITMTSEWAR